MNTRNHPTPVAVVGPDNLVEAGCECLVDASDEFRAVRAGETPEEVTTALDHVPAPIIVYYASAPSTRGPDLIAALRAAGHTPAFVAIIDPDDAALARACLGAGACACVATSSPPADLITAVRACRDGESFIASEVDQTISEDPVFSRLTNREREVLRLVASGATSQQTADQLGIAYKTVDSHRQSIAKKLGSRNVAELVKHAIRAGLVDVH